MSCSLKCRDTKNSAYLLTRWSRTCVRRSARYGGYSWCGLSHCFLISLEGPISSGARDLLDIKMKEAVT